MPFVVELDDAVGERRSPDKPNLCIGETVGDPAARTQRMIDGDVGPEWLRGHAVRGRPDLVPARFAGAKPELARLLETDGYTVNHGGRG